MRFLLLIRSFCQRYYAIHRKSRPKRGSSTGRAVDFKNATVSLYRVFNDGEAQPGATLLPGSALIHPIESLAQSGKVSRLYARSVVIYPKKRCAIGLNLPVHFDGRAGLRIFYGIGNKVITDTVNFSFRA